MENRSRFRSLLAVAIATITFGTSGGALAHDPNTDDRWDPDRLGDRLGKETIAARQHFFGLDNVNPETGEVRRDRVILSWYGVSSFAAAFNGHVVLLDGFLARGASGTWRHSAKYVGTTLQEIAALKPEVYFFGHGHSDHAGDLPTLVRANPSVPLVGAAEHCNDIEQEVRDVQFRCYRVFAAAAPFGQVAQISNNLLKGVGITAVKHPHSARVAGIPSFDTMQVNVRACPAAFDLYPPDGTEPTPWRAPTSGTVSISWQFRVGKFSLVWSDTTGSIANTNVPQAFASLPHTNVLLGSIAVSPRTVLNEHLGALKPQLFLPIHHDPCAYDVRREVEEQLATVPENIRPKMWYLSDPGDYLRPISFDPKAPEWKEVSHR